jgi:hypothetical protein
LAVTTPTPLPRSHLPTQGVPAITPRPMATTPRPLTISDRSRSVPDLVPSPPQKETPNASSSVLVDPFILDFGTSVNVNEDLRRTLRMEIQLLDNSIGQRKAILQEEASTEAQFQKDLRHAHSEMLNLSRGASDQLENARVHASFLMSLERQLNTEIVECITGEKCSVVGAAEEAVQPGRPSGDAHDHYHSVTPNPYEMSESSRRSESQSDPVFTYAELLNNKENRVADLIETLKNEKKELEAAHEQACTLKTKQSQLEQVIRVQGLEGALKKAQEEASRRQVEFQKDRDIYDAEQLELSKIQDECGSGAKNLVDLVRYIDE